jgi:HSP20 family protein
MQVRYENGWSGNGWLLNRMNGFARDFSRDFTTAPRQITPPAEVVEDKDAYRFYFEIPGLKSESLDVRVENGTLTIAGERKRPEWPRETRVHLAERSYGALRRAFELPEDADQEKVKAEYHDGILEITVEKRAETKPVKIHIN